MLLDFAVHFGFSQLDLVDFNTRCDNLLDVILTDDSIGADFMGPEGLDPPKYFGPGAHPANEPPPQ